MYVYNGLGALVENVWTIAKNGYGYHDVDAGNYTPLGDISTGSETNNGHGNGNSSGNTVGNNGNGNVKNPSTVVKQFVVDYTSETYEPLTEHEINGLDYRYVYGNDRLSVNVTGVETSSGNIVENGNQIRLYYHMDYLGTADYLTSPVSLKVTSWTHYNEWGEITHNAVLKCGMRELDMVKRYATHDYDAVLNMFYAKARFYDADNRRFASVDPILEPSGYDVAAYIDEPVQLVQYLYVKNEPLTSIDPLGLAATVLPSVAPNNDVEINLVTVVESYGGTVSKEKKNGKYGVSVSIENKNVFYPFAPTNKGGVSIKNNAILISMDRFDKDWLQEAREQKRVPYAGTVSYKGEIYSIYVPVFDSASDYATHGWLKPEASNASFALKNYKEEFSKEIPITWTDWTSFFAGTGAAKPEDDPSEDKSQNSAYKNTYMETVVSGAFGALGWVNGVGDNTHNYTVKVILYKNLKSSQRLATIELKDNALEQTLINNAGGYYRVLHCYDNGKNSNYYTQFNLSESRRTDQYLHYLYMKNGTMYGQMKKYPFESIQTMKATIIGDDKVVGVYKYGATPLGSDSLEKLIKSELAKEGNEIYIN